MLLSILKQKCLTILLFIFNEKCNPTFHLKLTIRIIFDEKVSKNRT